MPASVGVPEILPLDKYIPGGMVPVLTEKLMSLLHFDGVTVETIVVLTFLCRYWVEGSNEMLKYSEMLPQGKPSPPQPLSNSEANRIEAEHLQEYIKGCLSEAGA